MHIFKAKKDNLEHNLYINNINGILQALSLNLVTPFAGLYAKRLNANDTHIALLNSYPAIFCILSMFLGTYIFQKYKNKKKITSLFFIISRFFFLLFILIPFVPLWLQPGLFVFIYGAMNFPNSIANMGWQSFIGDLFSDNWRGRAFSKRSSLSNISALIVTFTTGNMLFYLPKNNNERIHLYQIFFGIAFIMALLEVYSFNKYKLDNTSNQVEIITVFNNEPFNKKIKSLFKIVISNKKFVSFCICSVLFHFSWQMGWPIFFSYEVDVLHSNESWTSLVNTVSFISQAVTFPLWQKLSEKKGNNYTIFLACISMACCPFFYIFARNMYFVLLFTIITGSAVAGTLLLLINNLYESAPNENRTLYLAVYTILTNITLIFAPLLGMKLKNITNIYFALFIVGVLRLCGSISFYIRYKKFK